MGQNHEEQVSEDAPVENTEKIQMLETTIEAYKRAFRTCHLQLPEERTIVMQPVIQETKEPDGGAISRTDTIDNGNKLLEKSDFIVNGKLHEKEGAKCIRLPYSMINKLFIPQFSSNAKKKALEMQILKNTEEKRAFAHVADVFVLLSKKRVSLFNAAQYIESNFKELKKMADSGRDSKIVTSVVHVTFDKSDEEVKDFDMITAEVGVISRYTEPDDRKIWDMYKTDKKKIVGMIARDIKTRPRFEKSGYTVSDFFLTSVKLTDSREIVFTFATKEVIGNIYCS